MKVQDDEIFIIEASDPSTLHLKSSTMKNPSTTKTTLSLLNHIKYEHLIAGISGGAISTLILHPLDLMKIRFAGK